MRTRLFLEVWARFRQALLSFTLTFSFLSSQAAEASRRLAEEQARAAAEAERRRIDHESKQRKVRAQVDWARVTFSLLFFLCHL